jgi:hypothetical protein
MNTLTEILRNVAGLFIDDEFLAIAVFAVVALTAFLTLFAGVSPLLAGAVLFGGNVLVLVLGVLRTARQNRPM